MKWITLFPFALGIAAVLQGGLNRQIAEHWGLAGAIFGNAVIFFGACAAYYLLALISPSILPSGFGLKGQLNPIRWWYLLPGLCGFLFVVGIPFIIPKVGALQVFLGVIAAQLVGGLLWDLWIEGISISWTRLLGSMLALLGAAIVSWR